MIEILSFVAMGFVLTQLWLMDSKKYCLGWWCALAACATWSIWCVATGAWALLAQQIVIAALSVRALRNLEN